MHKEIFKNHKILLIFIMLLAVSLRFPFLDHFPPALYSDEVSQGYNAYSILKTGRDEYGTFLPVSLRSFGDWKPPLQTYLMIPSIAIFGLNAWGVRLPSAILGTLTILVTYFLVQEVVEKFEIRNSKFEVEARKNEFFKSSNQNGAFRISTSHISLLTSLFLAISPWHILQSRSAMLVGITLFFLSFGILSFLKGIKHPRLWYLSSISFVIAIYGYYGMRLIVPLLFIFLTLWFRKIIVSQKKHMIGALCLGFIILLPLFMAFVSQSNVLLGRAKTVSVFYDKGVALTVWNLIAQDGVNMSPKLAQFLHNKPYHYAVDIIRRFFEHLDGRFLFLVGDQNPPFQIPNQGVLYLADGIVLIAGILYLVRHTSRLFYFLIGLITISIIPAALTYVTPASNRSFTAIVPLMIISSYGVFSIYGVIKKWGLLFIFYLSCFSYFLHNYFYVMPQQYANWWHYGYSELYAYLEREEKHVSQITISGKISVPYIFLLFYRQVDPKIAQTEIKRNYQADEFGFEHVDKLGKYTFLRYFSWEEDGERLPENSLLVVGREERVGENLRKIHEISYPDETSAFKIYTIEEIPNEN